MTRMYVRGLITALIVALIALAVSNYLIMRPESTMNDLGINIVVELLFVFATAFFTKNLIEYEETERRKRIKSIARELLNRKLSNLLGNIAMVCRFSDYSYEGEWSEERDRMEAIRSVMESVREIAEGGNLQIRRSSGYWINFSVIFRELEKDLDRLYSTYLDYWDRKIILKLNRISFKNQTTINTNEEL